MAELIKKQEISSKGENLLKAIHEADAWMLITLSEGSSNNATVQVRESGHEVMASLIAVLLENKELYDQVQKKMVQAALWDARKGKDQSKNNDLTVN